MLFLGYGLRRLVPALARVNIPAAVCGGLPVAAVVALFRASGHQVLAFDTTLQAAKPDRRFVYSPDGTIVRVEADTEGNGRFTEVPDAER